AFAGIDTGESRDHVAAAAGTDFDDDQRRFIGAYEGELAHAAAVATHQRADTLPLEVGAGRVLPVLSRAVAVANHWKRASSSRASMPCSRRRRSICSDGSSATGWPLRNWANGNMRFTRPEASSSSWPETPSMGQSVDPPKSAPV